MEWRERCPGEAAWTKPPQGWNWVNCPGRLLAEENIRSLLADTDWGLVKRDEEGFYMAFLYSSSAPFPLPPLFCLGRVDTMEDRRYLVFRFSRRGWIQPLYNSSRDGENTSGT